MNNIEKIKLIDKIEKLKSVSELYEIRKEYVFDLEIEKVCSIRLFKITKEYNYLYSDYLFSTFFGKNKPDDFFNICNKEYQRHKTDPVLLSILSICYFVGGNTFDQDITKSVILAKKALKYEYQYIKQIQYIIRWIAASIFTFVNDTQIQNDGLNILKKLTRSNFFEDKDVINRQISLSYLLKDNTKFALKYCEKIENCSAIYVNFLKGLCFYQENNFENSIQYFKQVLKDSENGCDSIPSIFSEEKELINISRAHLGIMMLEGKGTTKDVDAALRILQNCLNNGCFYSATILGNYFFSINDYNKASDYYLKSANAEPFNDAYSWYMLAKIYKEKFFNSPFKDKDELKEKCIICYKKAIDLGKYDVKINLAKFYLKLSRKNKAFLIMAEEELYEAQKLGVKEAQSELQKITSEEDKKPNWAEKFLKDLQKYTNNADDLYYKIEAKLNKRYSQFISKISSKVLSAFTGSIYDAILHLNDKSFVDYSSLIGSLSKGLELIIKEQILKKYKSFLFSENVPADEIEFIVPKDKQNVGEVRFTLKEFSKIRKDERFKKFSISHLNIAERNYNSYFDEVVELIDEFNSVRNPATHSSTIYLNRYINCLNILMFEKDLIRKILQLLK